MRPLASRLAPICLAAAALAAAAVTIAQEESPAVEPVPSAGFFDVLDVEIVNIDVWVHDADGDPVEGLGPEDFLVLRDGEPVDITNFYAVSGGRPVPERPERREALEDEGAPPDAEASPASPALPGLAPEVAEEHRLWLVVYVDNFNIDPLERNRILPELRAFLDRTVRNGDRAMLVTYDRALEVRHPFTESSADLYRVLDELEDESGLRLMQRRDQLEALQRIDRTDDPRQALTYARQYAELELDRIDRTIDSLRELVDSLAGLPGRKALLYVSSGVPMIGGEEMFYAIGDLYDSSAAYAEIPRHDSSRRFESLARAANAHRIVFHTLDAGGLRSFAFSAAEYPGFNDLSLRSTLESVVSENLQSPLRLMALETGGRAIVNRNQVLPALEEVRSDLGTFYSLGISSVGADTGRYHDIRVKLTDGERGRRLRYRSGYRSKDAHTRMREAVRSALLYSHEANPLGVEIAWEEPLRHEEDDRRWVLPVQLRIPMRDVVFMPLPDGRYEARLELYVGAAGEAGEVSEIDQAPLGVRIAGEHIEAAKGEALLHSHRLLLDPGRKKLGIGVRDMVGGGESIATRFVQVGPG